jgi:dolichol-phosphate mannosyltransferase
MIRLEPKGGAIRIVAVIPAYNVDTHLAEVLDQLPPLFSTAIVVDDASTDATLSVAQRSAAADSRIEIIRHETNQGVGAAMVTGFRRALEIGADVVVKIDGDGQMPPAFAGRLVQPLLTGEADYAKGNRFSNFATLQQMPFVRRVGNLFLSFLAKAATGYWRCFDTSNGYVAIRGDVLARLPLEKIDHGYYFETSMLCHLYLIGAVVRDVPMPARYAGEPSSLSVMRVLYQFPGRLLRSTFHRVARRHFLYDFDLESVALIFGFLLSGAGILFGGYHWVRNAQAHRATPIGTVMLAALLVIFGFQLLLLALTLDVAAVPHEPINNGPLGEQEP